MWDEALSNEDVERSLRLYDDFYVELGRRLDDAAARGLFVVLDLHSYNHRRDGADGPPAEVSANPEVNVGTGSLDRGRWSSLVDRFIGELSHRRVRDHLLDVRENVRFRGGELSRWVNTRYGDQGCALAVEFKKTFMDEWTGAVDEHHLEALRSAMEAVVPTLIAELGSMATCAIAQALPAADLAVDRTLADIVSSFRFLLDITPIDLVSARSDFAELVERPSSSIGHSPTTPR